MRIGDERNYNHNGQTIQEQEDLGYTGTYTHGRVVMQETCGQSGTGADERRKQISRGISLQMATVAWNLAEGGFAVYAGLAASSIALIGFGIDSFIETASAGIVGWRLWCEYRQGGTHNLEEIERNASRTAGLLLIALSAYVLFDSLKRLFGYGDHAHETLLGIGITVAALIVMPLLARAKLKVAEQIGSKALRTDAMETVCCAYLAATTLIGLVLNATLHWSWADPLVGLLIVPLLVREGLEGMKGTDCGCHHQCPK